MADPDPRFPSKEYKTSRRLRLLIFSFVAASLLVSMFVVLFSFVWNEFLAEPFRRSPYQARIEFLVPAILLITGLIFLRLWDAAEGRPLTKRAP